MGPIGLNFWLEWGRKVFNGLSILTNNFCFLSIAVVSYFYVVRVCDGVVGWWWLFFGDYNVSPNFLVVLGLVWDKN